MIQLGLLAILILIFFILNLMIRFAGALKKCIKTFTMLPKVPHYTAKSQFKPGDHFSNHRIIFFFSKKQDNKHKKGQTPKIQPKPLTDYIVGSESYKQNVIQIKNMQTTSEANIEEDSIKKIVKTQRQYLESSLKQQIETQIAGKVMQQTTKGKIFGNKSSQQQTGKYYLVRPFKYLQNVNVNLFAINVLGYTMLEISQNFNILGWFYGIFTYPAATSAIGLLLGFNLAFWIVKQSFFLNIPTSSIKSTSISLISTSWRNVAQLTFIASQFALFAYVISIPIAFPIYKAYILIAAFNFASLFLNLSQICNSAQVSYRTYLNAYVRLISTVSLLILLFAVYQIQILAGNNPENSFDSENYRKRIVTIKEGYDQFKAFFKAKKIFMAQNQKINPLDA